MKNIRAVFWDIDGTMVMSETIHEAKTRYVASQHGITVTQEMRDGFYGTTDQNIHQNLMTMGATCTLDEYLETCIAYYHENLDVVVLREGFMEAFTYFETRGAVQAAVSNGIKAFVDLNIDRAAIRDRLKAVIDVDYILAKGLNPKPAGDPYLEALRQVNEREGLSILPSECLVIEDSPAGVRAGKAAGMCTVCWSLYPGKTLPEADYEAHTGAELTDIAATLTKDNPIAIAV